MEDRRFHACDFGVINFSNNIMVSSVFSKLVPRRLVILKYSPSTLIILFLLSNEVVDVIFCALVLFSFLVSKGLCITFLNFFQIPGSI